MSASDCPHYYELKEGHVNCEMPGWHRWHDHPDIARHSGGSREIGYVGWDTGTPFDGVHGAAEPTCGCGEPEGHPVHGFPMGGLDYHDFKAEEAGS